MGLAPLQDAWDFRLAVEWVNPVFYLNAASLVFALIILVKLRDLRGMGRPFAEAGWWMALVIAVGAGLHLAGDLTNLPEEWDHILIHATLATALLVFIVKGLRGPD